MVLLLSGYHADTPITIKAEANPQGRQPLSLTCPTNAAKSICYEKLRIPQKRKLKHWRCYTF